MNRTSIEWTHREETGGQRGGFTWNPIRAKRPDYTTLSVPTFKTGTFCTRISPGCKNCYASTINKRFGTGEEYTVPNLAHHQFFLDARILMEPLQRKKPATIFVGDMFDLFHEAISDNLIIEVLAVCAEDRGHTYQILTKRAERMKRIVSDFMLFHGSIPPWMWFGVSVEDKQRAEERIPDLLQTTAAVHFLSVEPLLERFSLAEFIVNDDEGRYLLRPLAGTAEVLDSNSMDIISDDPENPRINWVICGGESGPHARPFNLAWAEDLLAECRAAGTPFFMKQIGANSYWFSDDRLKALANGGSDGFTRQSVHGKGGNMIEWPEHLRVREFPR